MKVGKGVAGWWREACWWTKVSFLGKAPRHFTQIKCPSLPLGCVLTYIRINCYRTHSRLHCYPKDIVNKMNWFSCSVQIIVFFNFSIYTTTPGSNHLHRPLRWNWLHLLSETIVLHALHSEIQDHRFQHKYFVQVGLLPDCTPERYRYCGHQNRTKTCLEIIYKICIIPQ